MRVAAAQRTRDMAVRVNTYMRPVELDYERDVVAVHAQRQRDGAPPLRSLRTQGCPGVSGYRTTRRLLEGETWCCPARPEPSSKNLIRVKMMKKGGVGYVQPWAGSFPLMADMNRFVLESGAIPTLAWLDGTSEGEKWIEEFFHVGMSVGAAALNIIPDRNYTPGVKESEAPESL